MRVARWNYRVYPTGPHLLGFIYRVHGSGKDVMELVI